VDRPKIVTIAVVILGLSLAFRIFSELSFLFSLADSSQSVSFQIGRAATPIAFYAFQGWVLWKVAQGRNWARITLLFLVLLNTGLALLVLGDPLGQLFVSPTIASLQVVSELIAIVFILWPTGYFSRPQDAA
jgi:hypothetical protein